MTMFDLITPAMAAEATATAVASGPPVTAFDSLMNFMPLFLILLVMYFFLLRPQQQTYQKHQQMLKGLRRGDRVVTGGGIIGTINKLEGEDVLVVEIAENVRVRVQRATITGVVARTEPIANSNEPEANKNAS
ncbi:MAG: preprotein translocase subunit YajC [Alphaproteobacteria bacterium]